MGSANRLTCFGARDQGTCTNHLTIRRDEVEARVLRALQEKLLRRDLFEEFCEEFTHEMNRLRMEHRASLTAAERELERVKKEIEKVIDAIVAGVKGSEVKDRMAGQQDRKEILSKQLEAANELPPLLHPSMSELYRTKVTQLADALERPDTRTEATEMLRGLIDEIVLTPDQGQLRIDLRGNLAAMLSAATNAKRPSDTDGLHLQVKLVAGACNQRYLQLWSGAA